MPKSVSHEKHQIDKFCNIEKEEMKGLYSMGLQNQRILLWGNNAKTRWKSKWEKEL